MSTRTRGRHRAPGRFNPAVNLSAAVVRHAGPAARTSAVLVMSGGVAVTLAVPAQADPSTHGAADATPSRAVARQVPVDSGAGTSSATPTSNPADANARSSASPTAGSLTTQSSTSASSTNAASTASAGTATAATSATSTAATPATDVATTAAPRGSVTPTSPATAVEPAAATQPQTRTIDYTGARPSVVSSQTLTKRLDRAAVRSRSVAASQQLNETYPQLTRTITRTVRNQTSTAATAKGSAAVTIASGLTGIWYRWGGSTPAGFDCSGFTSYVYRKMGVRLPRTAAGQQAYARKVSTPRPGDLVFFGSPAHHVGIYAGDGMMYDSPRTGRKTQLRKVYTSRVTYGRIA